MIDTVIVSGGMIQKDFALDFIRKIEEERKGKKLLLLAADRGLDFFLETGLVPDIVDGDFDSLSGAGKAYLESLDHTEIVRLNPEKDDTDTMLAVKQALSLGAEEIQIYGGLGGRFDHSIANVQTLRYLSEHGAVGSLCDAQNWMTVQTAGTVRQYPRRDGWYFSLLSLSDTCTGVTITGAKYCLQNGILHANFPLGISNEIVAEQAEISLQTGTLLVLYTKDA